MNQRERRGRGKWPYNTEHWRRLRLEALEYHGDACMECGCGPETRRLDIHHDPPLTEEDREKMDKARGLPHPAYLRVLCVVCHSLITNGVPPTERKRRRAWRSFIETTKGWISS